MIGVVDASSLDTAGFNAVIITYLRCWFQMLKEEITPTLAKLKEERSSFLEYQKIIRELEHLDKLYIAYKFVCAEVCLYGLFDRVMCLLTWFLALLSTPATAADVWPTASVTLSISVFML